MERELDFEADWRGIDGSTLKFGSRAVPSDSNISFPKV